MTGVQTCALPIFGEPGGLQAKEKEQIEAHYRRVFSALNQPRLDRRDPAWRGAILRMLVEFSSTEPLPPEWIDLAIASVQSGPREEALACAWLLSKKPFESVVHTGSEWLDSSVQRGIESADDPMMLMALAGMNRSQLDRWVVRWMEEATKRLDDRKMVRSFALVPWKRLVSSVAKPDNPTWTQARDAWLADALKRLELAPQSETDRRLSQEPALLLQLAIAQGIGASADRGWLGKQRALWEGWLRRLEEPDWSSAVRSELIETLGLSIEPDQSELCSKGLQVALEKSHAPEVRRLLVGAW